MGTANNLYGLLKPAENNEFYSHTTGAFCPWASYGSESGACETSVHFSLL